MSKSLSQIVRFITSEEGPTTVEYAAIFFLLLLGALTIITAVGQATAVGPNPV